MPNIVIVGNGMAGHRIATELHTRLPDAHITVYGTEHHPAYNRVLLTNLLAGKADEHSIRLPTPPPGITVRPGTTVTAIDRTTHTVTTTDHTTTPYDTLVLATGATAQLPPIKRLHGDNEDHGHRLLPGIVALRTLDDAREISDRIDQASQHSHDAVKILVLGGGLLGLETARGLIQRHPTAHIQILQAGPRLMERQLDHTGSRTLHNTLTALGIHVRAGTHVTEVTGKHQFQGVRCADGQHIPADLLILACGMRPNTTLATAAGLPVQRGITVDDHMRTADPHILAIGDCAEHRGRLYGLIQPAWEQAATAARTITAHTTTEPPHTHPPYTGTHTVTRLKTTDIDLATMGDTHTSKTTTDEVTTNTNSTDEAGTDEAGTDEAGNHTEVLTYLDTSSNTYHKVTIRNGRITSAILIGNSTTVSTISQMYDQQTPVPRDRRLLLFPELTPTTTPPHPTRDPLICHCNAVSQSEIIHHRNNGARSITAIAQATKATTGCGTCQPLIETLLTNPTPTPIQQ